MKNKTFVISGDPNREVEELTMRLRRSLNGLREYVYNRPYKGRPPLGCTDATFLRWVLKDMKAQEKAKQLAIRNARLEMLNLCMAAVRDTKQLTDIQVDVVTGNMVGLK